MDQGSRGQTPARSDYAELCLNGIKACGSERNRRRRDAKCGITLNWLRLGWSPWAPRSPRTMRMICHIMVNAIVVMLAAGSVFLWTLRNVGEAPSLADVSAEYNDGVVRAGVIATAFWGVVGFLVGVAHRVPACVPAAELRPGPRAILQLRAAAAAAHQRGDLRLRWQRADHERLLHRPAHQRRAAVGRKPGMVRVLGLAADDRAGRDRPISWAARKARNTPRPVWYIDIWITVVWVAFLLTFMGTLMTRKEPHIYVANWFLLSMIVTVAMLHLVNNAAIPVSIFGRRNRCRSIRACRMRWCSGGTATTRWASS